MGASVFPEGFRGIAVEGMIVTPLTTGRATGSAKFIGPSASANVVGRANAIASAVVISFMTYPVDNWVARVRQIRDTRTVAIKSFFSAIVYAL